METLEQLRAKNAAEAEATVEIPQVETEDETTGAANDPNADRPDADRGEQEEGAEAEVESWMKGDDQESQGADRKFTDSDVAAAKNNLRAKLEAKHKTELEELRQKLDALQRQQQVPQQTARPTREQFFDKDDPEDAYAEALVEWKMGVSAAQQQASQQRYEQERAQLEFAQAVESAVDQHYVRAAKLTEQSGISPELYRSADERVRTAVDQVSPGAGEAVTNHLIATIGEGSERVMYNLGVNKARLGELVDLLQKDPTGLRAATFLGKLSAELTAPAKRKSNAPAPATSIQGDSNASDASQKLMRQYKEAHAKGNVQAAFDLKRKAKQAGHNTTSW